VLKHRDGQRLVLPLEKWFLVRDGGEHPKGGEAFGSQAGLLPLSPHFAHFSTNDVTEVALVTFIF